MCPNSAHFLERPPMTDIIDIHTHTIASMHAYSTIREMAAAAKEKGLALLGISDHAPAMPGTFHELYFHNFKVIRPAAYGIDLIMGAELNVLDHTGAVDLPEKALKKLHYAIASLHDLVIAPGSQEENTAALLGAVVLAVVWYRQMPGEAVKDYILWGVGGGLVLAWALCASVRRIRILAWCVRAVLLAATGIPIALALRRWWEIHCETTVPPRYLPAIAAGVLARLHPGSPRIGIIDLIGLAEAGVVQRVEQVGEGFHQSIDVGPGVLRLRISQRPAPRVRVIDLGAVVRAGIDGVVDLGSAAGGDPEHRGHRHAETQPVRYVEAQLLQL